ncbi:DoxX family protein [Pelagicoccus albus]|nr:DoxX family protein [Pelagicoccus albus]
MNTSKDIALLVLRITFGGLMLVNHGWGKLMSLISGGPIEFLDPIGLGPAVSLSLAVLAEVVCSALVVLGFYTRVAMIPLIATMAVAVFSVHWSDPFKDKESALIYLGAFVAIALLGAGRFAIDGLRASKKIVINAGDK